MTTRQTRRPGAAGVVAVFLAVGLVVGATTVVAQSGEGDATLEVALPETPDGLAGYQLTIALDGGTVTGASYPDAFQPTTEPEIGSDGRTVALEAADVSNAISAGDGEVRLATVTVEGLDGEQPAVRVTDAEIDADGGDRIDAASVVVSVQGASETDVRTGDGDDGGTSVGDATGGDDTTPGDAPTGAGGPGFGILAAVGALLAIGILTRRP